MQTAVKVFVIEPMRYAWSGDASSPRSTSASPIARVQTTSPLRKTAALIEGRRRSACAAATSLSSSSDANMRAQGLRDEIAGSLDLVGSDVEVRHGADHRRVDRRRQAHTGLAKPSERLVARQAEGCEVDLDEVRLDSLQVDGEAGTVPRLGKTARVGVILGQTLDVVVE